MFPPFLAPNKKKAFVRSESVVAERVLGGVFMNADSLEGSLWSLATHYSTSSISGRDITGGRSRSATNPYVYVVVCANVAAAAWVAVAIALAERRRVTELHHLKKGWFRILDVGPHLQVSQCAIYQWGLLRHTSPSPSSSAEFAGARLAQGNGFCRPAKENTPSHSAVPQRQINYKGGLST